MCTRELKRRLRVVAQCVQTLNVALEAAWGRFVLDPLDPRCVRFIRQYSLAIYWMTKLAVTRGVTGLLTCLKGISNEARLAAFEVRRPRFLHLERVL
jgi:hypothetical protein